MPKNSLQSKGQGWLDIDVDGRRLERIIKLCETMIESQLKDKNREGDDLILAYIDRLIKAINQKAHTQDMALNINLLIKLAQQTNADEIVQLKLKAIK